MGTFNQIGNTENGIRTINELLNSKPNGVTRI